MRGEIVEVGQHVAIAGQAEEDPSVVADHSDRERMVLRRERDEG
jgi:hypothetical protein